MKTESTLPAGPITLQKIGKFFIKKKKNNVWWMITVEEVKLSGNNKYTSQTKLISSVKYQG